MTLQHVLGGATIVVFAVGVVAVEPASAQRRDGSLLPQEESGQVTAVGCLVKGGTVRGGDKNRYTLARPKRGPATSVPEATCTADAGADALDLDNESGQAGVTDAMVGRWVEITGRLERETSKDPDDLRELDVKTVKLMPVVVPKPPAPAPAPAPAAAEPRPTPRAPEPTPPPPAAAPAPAPEAPRSLPKTASPVPVIGLAGLLSLGVGFTIRSFRLRRRG